LAAGAAVACLATAFAALTPGDGTLPEISSKRTIHVRATGQKSEIWMQFSTPVAFEALRFKNRAMNCIENIKHMHRRKQ